MTQHSIALLNDGILASAEYPRTYYGITWDKANELARESGFEQYAGQFPVVEAIEAHWRDCDPDAPEWAFGENSGAVQSLEDGEVILP